MLTGRDCHNGVGDLVAKVGLRSLLHLAKNHGGDFLRGEGTILTLVLDHDSGFAILLGYLERPVLDVALELGIIHLTTDETFGVKNCVLRVGVESVLGGVTNTNKK